MMSSQYYDEDDEWERTEQALASLQLNIPEPPQLITPPDPPATGEDHIDPALLNALNNSRERMILFQIEDMLLRFVRSPEGAFEVPPGLNSFRRLLVYRLAVRFGLVHITSEVPNETGERSIIIYKTPTTLIPKVLLIDYNDTVNETVSPVTPVTSSEPREVPRTDPGGNSAVPSAPSTSAGPDPGKKVLLMKRQTSNTGNASNKNQESKPQMSAEERERAYQEARARIFGVEGAVSGESSKRDSPAGTKSSSPAPFVEESTSGKMPSEVDKETTKNSSSVTEKVDNTSTVSSSSPVVRQERIGRSGSNNNLPSDDREGFHSASSSMKRSTSNPQVQKVVDEDNTYRRLPSGSRKGKLVDVGSWKENKSQIRNLEAEKSDPDFVRRGSPNVSQGTANTAGMMTGDASNPTMYGQMMGNNVPYDPRQQIYPSYVYDPSSGRGNPAYGQGNMQYSAYPSQMYNNPYMQQPGGGMPPNGYPYPYPAPDGMWNQPAGYDYSHNRGMIPPVNQSFPTPNEAWQQQQQLPRGQTSPYARGQVSSNSYGRSGPMNNRQDFPPLG